MGSEYQTFLEDVERRTDLADRDDAADATAAVLSTLGESIDESVSQRVDGEVPSEVGDHLTDGPSGRRLSEREFRDRIDERAERADVGEPGALAGAVTATLLEHVDDDRREAIVAELEGAGYEETIDRVEASLETND